MAGVKLRQVLGGKKLELDWGIRVFFLQALARRPDHAFRPVTGKYGNVMLGKEERVFAGTAIEFQDVGAGLKGVEKRIPYGSALGAANHGAGKQVVIALQQYCQRREAPDSELRRRRSCFHL